MSAQAAPPQTPAGGQRDDVQPVSNETLDRFLTGTITVIPFVGLGVAAWQAWNDLLHWHDLVVFALVYALTGLGVTVGFHRHFTHRSFKAHRAVRAIARGARLGGDRGPGHLVGRRPSQAPRVLRRGGRPAQPARRPRRRLARRAARLFHAHVGWLFIHTQRGSKQRYAPDLLADPVVRFVDRTFVLWVGGRARGAVRARLADRRHAGGRADRAAVGRRGADARRPPRHLQHQLALPRLRPPAASTTGDESRNLAWLAPFTFGEAWHNNHHAFPTSAVHGLRPRPGRHLRRS